MAPTPSPSPTRIVIDAVPGETRLAWLDLDDRLIDLIIERDSPLAQAGSVYLGRVVRVVKALNAAFIDLGDGQGFLPLGKSQPLTEGAAVVVQVSTSARPGKEAKLTRAVELGCPLAVLTPLSAEIGLSRKITAATERQRLAALVADWQAGTGYGDGLLLRTAAATATPTELTAQLDRLLSHWRAAQTQIKTAQPPLCALPAPGPVAEVLAKLAPTHPIICDSQALANRLRAAHSHLAAAIKVHSAPNAPFAHLGVEAEIEAALAPTIALPGGGNLIIEPTAALVAIDVNAGPGAKGAGGRADATALATNLDALDVIARQLRVRNLGGTVVVDLLTMQNRAHRDQVLAAAKTAFAADPALSVAGLTRLGNLELTRARTGPTLAEAMDATGTAYAVLRAVQASARIQPRARIGVRASADLIAALDGPAQPARQRLEHALGTAFDLTADPELGPGEFNIIT